jgi:hypothetical protein
MNSTTIKKHAIPLFLIIFPLLWACLIEESLIKSVLSSLGGVLASLTYYWREAATRKQTEIQTLQHVKTKLNGDTVLLSHIERQQLGTEMKEFQKEHGQIANATNNQDRLEKYRVSEKMMQKFKSLKN